MTTSIRKLFYCILGFLLALPGAALVSLRFQTVEFQQAQTGLAFLLYDPAGQNMTLIAGAALCALGLLLLILALSIRPAPKAIEIHRGGEILSVPVPTITAFVTQTLAERFSVSDFTVRLKKRGKWLHVDVVGAFENQPSISTQANAIRETLKSELTRVFDFGQFRVDFRVVGIRTQAQQAPVEAQPAPAPVRLEQPADPAPPTASGSGGSAPTRESIYEIMPWKRLPDPAAAAGAAPSPAPHADAPPTDGDQGAPDSPSDTQTAPGAPHPPEDAPRSQADAAAPETR